MSAPPAVAAESDQSEALGQVINADLLGLDLLDTGTSLTGFPSDPEEQANPLNLTVLEGLNLELGSLTLPLVGAEDGTGLLHLGEAGALSSYAVSPDATSSTASAGAVGQGGALDLDGIENGEYGSANVELTDLLGQLGVDGLTDEIVDQVSLELGAAGSTATADGTEVDSSYVLADGQLQISSPLVGTISTELDTALTGVGDSLDAAVGTDGALGSIANAVDIDINLGLVGVDAGGGDIGITGLDAALDEASTTLLAEPLVDSNNLVSIDLADGTIAVDLQQLGGENGLNGLDANTELLDSHTIGLITEAVSEALGTVSTKVGEILVDDVFNNVGLTVELPADVSLLGGSAANVDIVVETTLGQLAGTAEGEPTIDIDGSLLGIIPIGTLLNGLLEPVTELLIEPLQDVIGGVLDTATSGLTDTLDGVINPLLDTLSPILSGVLTEIVSVTINDQPTPGELGAESFTVNAVTLELLPNVLGDSAVAVSLASSTVRASDTAAEDPNLSVDPGSVNDGESTTVTGDSYPPNTDVEVQLFSPEGDPVGDPVTVTTDENGSFTTDLTVPADTPAGDFTVEGTTADDETATADLIVTNADDPTDDNTSDNTEDNTADNVEDNTTDNTEANEADNTTDNTEANEADNTTDNTEVNEADNTTDNTDVNTTDNTEVNEADNTTDNTDVNTTDNTEVNEADNTTDNTEANEADNTTDNTDVNTTDNTEVNEADNTTDNTEVNTTDNTEVNEADNTTDNTEANEADNTADNADDNTEVNTTDNTEVNEADNTTDNTDVNTTDNTEANEADNTTDNTEANEADNTTDNTEANEADNTTDNTEANEADNTTDNTEANEADNTADNADDNTEVNTTDNTDVNTADNTEANEADNTADNTARAELDLTPNRALEGVDKVLVQGTGYTPGAEVEIHVIGMEGQNVPATAPTMVPAPQGAPMAVIANPGDSIGTATVDENGEVLFRLPSDEYLPGDYTVSVIEDASTPSLQDSKLFTVVSAEEAAEDPGISVDPGSVQDGDSTTVTGENFPPNAEVQVQLQDSEGNPVGEAIEVITSEDGAFESDLPVPSGTDAGDYTVEATYEDGEGEQSVVTALEVTNADGGDNGADNAADNGGDSGADNAADNGGDNADDGTAEPAVTVDPDTAAPGDTITVEGENFPPNSEVEVQLEDSEGNPIGDPVTVITDDEGSFSEDLVILDGTLPGDYTIVATDEDGNSASADLTVTAAGDDNSADNASDNTGDSSTGGTGLNGGGSTGNGSSGSTGGSSGGGSLAKTGADGTAAMIGLAALLVLAGGAGLFLSRRSAR